MIKYKTIDDGVKAKIITKDKEPKILHQKITDTGPISVEVMSMNGKRYFVSLSDRVRLTLNYNIGDTAVIKCFETGWLVVDIIHSVDDVDVASSEVEDYPGDY